MAKTSTTRSNSKSKLRVTGQGLEDEALFAFKEHWADMLRRARRGRPLGRKIWGCFEGDTKACSQALAAEFFGVVHARKMFCLTPRQIRRRLSCYLPRAIEYAMDALFDPREQRAFIRELVTGIYVIFDSNQCTCMEAYDEHFEGLYITTYPAGVDDWCERSTGSSFFTCNTKLLMKSTGENFSEREFDSLEKSIQQNLDLAGPEELYGFACEALTPSKIWVKIRIMEREWYVENVMAQAARLVGGRLRTFVENAVEVLAREPVFAPGGRTGTAYIRNRDVPVPGAATERLKKRLFGSVERLSENRILEKLGKLLVSRKIDNAALRGVEDILNCMLGQELRTHHDGVKY